MNTFVKIVMGLCVLIMFFACEYDNYDEPNLTFEGSLVYDGIPIGVSYNDVAFELWEMGWQEQAPINVAVDQDGSFSALLFRGDYKLVIPAGRGPFRTITNPETQSDTLLVNVESSTNMNIEVMPYYMIRNSNFSHSGGSVSATFDLDQIMTGENSAGIDEVSLYLSKTQFVDNRTSIASVNIPGSEVESLSNIQLEVSIPEMTPSQDYLFARIGIRIQGVEHRLFSEIERIEF